MLENADNYNNMENNQNLFCNGGQLLELNIPQATFDHQHNHENSPHHSAVYITTVFKMHINETIHINTTTTTTPTATTATTTTAATTTTTPTTAATTTITTATTTITTATTTTITTATITTTTTTKNAFESYL